MGSLLAIDTTPITTALSDLTTAGLVVVSAGVAASVAIFGIIFLWRKAQKAVSS